MSTTTPTTRADRRTARRADPDALPFGKLLAWAGAGASAGANVIILGYLTIYATDTLGMQPTTIGLLIALATVLNAVMAFVGAIVVDRSPETRWGKARPYELAVPLTWLATALLFATPAGFGAAGRVVWLGVMLFVIRGIADPLLRANDMLYMARAFPGRMVYAKVQTRAGIVTALGAVTISITLPMMLARAGRSPEGWALVIGVYAAILTLIGLSRGIFVKEVYREAGEDPITFSDMAAVLRGTKWIWAIVGMQFVSSALVGANVGAYYYRYIVGNLALQGVVAAIGLVLLPTLLIVPRLMRRFAVSRIIMVAALIGVVGGVINFFAGASVPLLMVALILTGFASLPVAYLFAVLILDVATYNESRGLRRLESTLGAVVGVGQNLGTAVIAGIVGFLMSSSGYVGTSEVQSESALLMIRILFGALPAVGYLLIAGFMFAFSTFERDLLPDAQAKVAEMRQSRGLTARGAEASSAQDTNADGVIEADEFVVPPVAINAQGLAVPVENLGAGPVVESEPEAEQK